MIFWSDDKIILLLQDYLYDIEDSLKINPFFIKNKEGVNHQEISLVLLWKGSKLSFYLVCDSEECFETNEREGRTYQNKVFRIYLQKYFVSEKDEFIKDIISALNCGQGNSFIRFTDVPAIKKFELKPFGTVLPVGDLHSFKYNYLKPGATTKETLLFAKWLEKAHHVPIIVKPNSTIIQSAKRLESLNDPRLNFVSKETGTLDAKALFSRILTNALDKKQVEFKSSQHVSFTDEYISDRSELYCIKKGVEFFFEELHGELNLVFNYSNFLRSAQCIEILNLKEPLNHIEHKFVNIRTGRKISNKVLKVRELKNPENYFETFKSTDIYDLTEGKIRFSQQAFYYQQTNLTETVRLIWKFKEQIDSNVKILDFDRLNDLQWDFRFVKRTKKLIFNGGDLHYTPSKGLHHSGVLQVPEKLKLQVLISKKALEVNGDSRILGKINEAIIFLYKDQVSPLTKNDLLIYDYNDFNHSTFSHNIDNSKRVLTYLIDPQKTSHRLTLAQIEKTSSINEQIINILKQSAGGYSLIGEIDKYVFANAILKIGLNKGAIPWKINSIDMKDDNHVFIGIDLGHNHLTRKSNLTLTAINNQGCFIAYQKEEIDLNEMIPLDVLNRLSKQLFKRVQKKVGNLRNITIHRDGRYFENILDFVQAVTTAYAPSILSINLVEVIKSEVPLIGFVGNGTYLDAFEGLYFLAGQTAYLITNDQSLATNTAPKPLKIRKIWGDKTIEDLTEEVYWLTKPYSINLFTPSKLPLTTLLSNNLGYSKNLIHFITA